MNIVGKRVKEARRLHGPVSQEELAARLQAMGIDFDRTIISKIENGVHTVSDIEIAAICKALGVKVSYLFEGE